MRKIYWINLVPNWLGIINHCSFSKQKKTRKHYCKFNDVVGESLIAVYKLMQYIKGSKGFVRFCHLPSSMSFISGYWLLVITIGNCPYEFQCFEEIRLNIDSWIISSFQLHLQNKTIALPFISYKLNIKIDKDLLTKISSSMTGSASTSIVSFIEWNCRIPFLFFRLRPQLPTSLNRCLNLSLFFTAFVGLVATPWQSNE